MASNHHALKKMVEVKLPRSLGENEQESVSSFSMLSKENIEELMTLKKSSDLFAIAYLQYILTENIAFAAGSYVSEVLSGRIDVDKFNKSHRFT
ncbi:hypothetical protein ACO0LD_22925 [Undibacterium sp. Ji83W]|uniref:hypothetical protein n=1 Tax=Undibacterium sp. Ji83W TaxID=3413043 RepID=UPI003BF2B374